MSGLNSLEDLLRKIIQERDLVEERRLKEQKERNKLHNGYLMEMENRLMSVWKGKTVQM